MPWEIFDRQLFGEPAEKIGESIQAYEGSKFKILEVFLPLRLNKQGDRIL